METSSDRRLDPAEICTLPPRELGERIVWIRRNLVPHVVGSSKRGNTRSLELEDSPDLAWKLERWIEAERECCSGITLEAHPSETPGRIRLEIGGVDPDAEVFRTLGSPSQKPGMSRPGARLAASLGLGTLGALLVCCIVPLAAVALLGGSVAFLTALDAPLPIALVAIAIAAVTWRGWGRKASQTSDANATCCAGES